MPIWDSAYQVPTGGLDPKTRQAEQLAALERRISTMERSQSVAPQAAYDTQSGGVNVTTTTNGVSVDMYVRLGGVILLIAECALDINAPSTEARVNLMINSVAIQPILSSTSSTTTIRGTAPGSSTGVDLLALHTRFSSPIVIPSYEFGAFGMTHEAVNTFQLQLEDIGGGSSDFSNQYLAVACL